MKVKLVFNAQFCGYAEVDVEVPDDSTDEYIESLFEKEIGCVYNDDCSYIKDSDYIHWEDPYIYDGWILRFHPVTKDIKWRDFYIIQRLSPEKKLEIEEYIKNLEFNG